MIEIFGFELTQAWIFFIAIIVSAFMIAIGSEVGEGYNIPTWRAITGKIIFYPSIITLLISIVIWISIIGPDVLREIDARNAEKPTKTKTETKVIYDTVKVEVKTPIEKKKTKFKFTKLDLGLSHKLSRGVTDRYVKQIMGEPVLAEHFGDYTAWHYCNTGGKRDEFLVVIFKKKSMERTFKYTNRDEYGDCSQFTRPYDWKNLNITPQSTFDSHPDKPTDGPIKNYHKGW